jgi:hypothetical protein
LYTQLSGTLAIRAYRNYEKRVQATRSIMCRLPHLTSKQ